MSTTTTKPAPRVAQPRPTDTSSRTAARGAREPPVRGARSGRLAFVIVVVALLGAGLVTLLLLNIALAQDSYRLHALQQQTALLGDRKAQLRQQVASESTPDALAKKARKQGMVPAGPPAFLDVPSGHVRGDPKPARAHHQRSAGR